MKPYAGSPLWTVLKFVSFLLVIGVLSFMTIAMKAKEYADDVWKHLGLSIPDANRNINNSFFQAHLQYYGAKNAARLPPEKRVAIVNDVVGYARIYLGSSEFKSVYKTFRDRRKPEEPGRFPIDAESLRAEEKERLQRNLKMAEEGLNSPNPKIKNGAPARIEHIKKELAAVDNPDNPTIKRRLADADRSYEYALKLHAKAMEKYLMEYPEDPNEMLKKRLLKIIEVTEDVDYSAELKEMNNLKVFVNPVYEKKPAEWKLAFRAGKPTTDAVRSAAQQWLKELK